MDTVKRNRRDCLCLNGEWDFMPYLDREAADELPDPIIYEEEKVCVPSSWRGFDDKFHIPEYEGMGVYKDSEVCCHAVALKEKLFLEYARRMDVTGISSFNIAH